MVAAVDIIIFVHSNTELAPIYIVALLRAPLLGHRLAGLVGDGLAVLLGDGLTLLPGLRPATLHWHLVTLLPAM